MVMLKTFTYIILFFTMYLFYISNSLLPDPYMDEIFHFPQGVKYYKGNFSYWDPKITTPPGLYLYTIALLHPISWISTLDVTKVQCFRLVNLTFAIGIMCTVYNIFKHFLMKEKLETKYREKISLLSSLNITMFPVLYFFNFLYYTDCGSTFFVILMYCWHLKKFYFLASLAGAISLLFRQTNIVWIFFVATEESLRVLLDLFCKEIQTKEKDVSSIPFSQLLKISAPLIKRNFKEIFLKLLRMNAGYLLVGASFLIFLKVNGSVALGDKEAHQVCFHLPQLFYFLFFFNIFSSPYLISFHNCKKFLNFVYNNKMFVFELCFSCAFCLAFMSHVHPYLLADNRHFTFYIWRRILGRNLFVPYMLIPVYIFSGWSLLSSIEHRDFVFKFAIAFAVFVSVVPQKLLEFRYFIIPYIMLRLHLKVESKWQPYLEFLLYTIVNCVTLYLFFFSTFKWENSEEIQRFMW